MIKKIFTPPNCQFANCFQIDGQIIKINMIEIINKNSKLIHKNNYKKKKIIIIKN